MKVTPIRRAVLLGPTLFAALGCRATTTGGSSSIAPTPVRNVGERVAVAGEAPRVRAREARAVPRCTAGEIVSLASTSVGVDPRAALARTAQGGMVAYIARDRAGAQTLSVLALGANGAPSGSPRVVAGATAPSAPALTAISGGFLLAFRDVPAGPGPESDRERIVVMKLGADGANAPWPGTRAAIASGPLQGAVELASLANSRGFGAPALSVANGRAVLAVLRGSAINAQRALLTVDDVAGAWTERARAIEGLPSFSRAPALLAGSSTRVAFEAARGPDGSAVMYAAGDAAPSPVATDVLSPSLVDTPRATLLGYAAMDPYSSTIRVKPLGAEEGVAPSSLATFASSSDTDVSLVRLGDDLVGAVTLSHMADDATGSVNVSLSDAQGAFVGRFAALASIRLRSSRTVAASEGSSIWTLLDGRADDGAPVLGMVAVQCDATREASAQSLPTATMLQEPAVPSDPLATAENPGATPRCTATGTSAILSSHVPEGEDSTAGQSWRSIVLPDGRVALFAHRRIDASHREYVAVAARPDGTVQPLGTLAQSSDSSSHIVDVGLYRGLPVALDSADRVLFAGVGPNIRALRIGDGYIRSGRFVRGGAGLAFVRYLPGTGETLEFLPLGSTRSVTLTEPLSSQGARGSIDVLDAVSVGSTVHVLLGRGSINTALVRTVLTFDASPRALAARRPTASVFADPLSIGGTGGALAVSGRVLTLFWFDRNTLRAGRVDGSALRDLRSVFGYMGGGGRFLSMTSSSADSLTFTATPGFPSNVDDMPWLPFAVTTHGADGALRSLALSIPNDTSAITTLGEGHAVGNGVAVVFAKALPNGQLQWLVQRGTCAASAASTTNQNGSRPAAGGAR
ncbi:MAG: hypothetical protein JNK05_12570 [Myxococcales bacterium]|nr:hypothetical protein [Myxococcales bacterium]